MHILLVKTSSLGDVIHNLPVVSDLRRGFPEARIDWCVEESFAEIPRLHPDVNEVIPVAIRRWRRTLGQRATWQEIRAFMRRIRQRPYDAVLDTQGLIKSAVITRLAHGPRLGYDGTVAREAMAARFYDETFIIPPNAHAVERNRWLAAAAFDSPLDWPLDYGLTTPDVALPWLTANRYAVLLTATSRDDKLWDEAHWIQLARALSDRGVTPVLPSGKASERERAERIVAAVPHALVAPPMNLRDLAALIGKSALVVGVDTGLAHLAAALRVPTIALYITTDPALTGVFGTGFFRNLGGPGHAPTLDEVMRVTEQALR